MVCLSIFTRFILEEISYLFTFCRIGQLIGKYCEGFCVFVVLWVCFLLVGWFV